MDPNAAQRVGADTKSRDARWGSLSLRIPLGSGSNSHWAPVGPSPSWREAKDLLRVTPRRRSLCSQMSKWRQRGRWQQQFPRSPVAGQTPPARLPTLAAISIVAIKLSLPTRTRRRWEARARALALVPRGFARGRNSSHTPSQAPRAGCGVSPGPGEAPRSTSPSPPVTLTVAAARPQTLSGNTKSPLPLSDGRKVVPDHTRTRSYHLGKPLSTAHQPYGVISGST